MTLPVRPSGPLPQAAADASLDPGTGGVQVNVVGGSVTVAAGADRISAGSIQSAGGGAGTVSVNTQACSSCLVQVAGTWTGAILFEALEPDGLTWTAVNGVVPTTGVEATTTTANGVWEIACAGFQQVRARGNTVGTGTATIGLEASTAVQVVALGIPLPTGNNVIGATKLADGVTPGQFATVAVFHNADNQALSGTSYGLLTGGVSQLLNASGNLDRQRSATADAMPTTGISAEAAMIWNGTTFDRLREATADALAATGIAAEAPALYNGASFDRMRSQSAANATAMLAPSPMTGIEMCSVPAGWRQNSAPAAATQATTTLAAGAAGVRHVCTSITVSIACGATAQTPINVYLRDGATGAGPIIWAGALAAPVNGMGFIALSNLAIPGSAATAMTLEFSAAGLAASLEAVSMTGYDIS